MGALPERVERLAELGLSQTSLTPVLREHKIKTDSKSVYYNTLILLGVKITKLFFASIIALAPGVAIAQNQLPQVISVNGGFLCLNNKEKIYDFMSNS